MTTRPTHNQSVTRKFKNHLKRGQGMENRMKQIVEHNKELAYYLTLYKLEGNETWRADLKKTEDGFDIEWESQKVEIKPKITEKQVLRIDRISGLFSSGI